MALVVSTPRLRLLARLLTVCAWVCVAEARGRKLIDTLPLTDTEGQLGENNWTPDPSSLPLVQFETGSLPELQALPIEPLDPPTPPQPLEPPTPPQPSDSTTAPADSATPSPQPPESRVIPEAPTTPEAPTPPISTSSLLGAAAPDPPQAAVPPSPDASVGPTPDDISESYPAGSGIDASLRLEHDHNRAPCQAGNGLDASLKLEHDDDDDAKHKDKDGEKRRKKRKRFSGKGGPCPPEQPTLPVTPVTIPAGSPPGNPPSALPAAPPSPNEPLPGPSPSIQAGTLPISPVSTPEPGACTGKTADSFWSRDFRDILGSRLGGGAYGECVGDPQAGGFQGNLDLANDVKAALAAKGCDNDFEALVWAGMSGHDHQGANVRTSLASGLCDGGMDGVEPGQKCASIGGTFHRFCTAEGKSYSIFIQPKGKAVRFLDVPAIAETSCADKVDLLIDFTHCVMKAPGSNGLRGLIVVPTVGTLDPNGKGIRRNEWGLTRLCTCEPTDWLCCYSTVLNGRDITYFAIQPLA